MKTQLLKGIALASVVTVMSSPLFAQAEDTSNQARAQAADTSSQSTAQAADKSLQPAEPVGEEAGYGVGAALASVFYTPTKLVYAGLGLLTGGLGYVVSGGRADVANNIIYPAVRGNYVVTPNHLKGTDPIYFVGPGPDVPEPETIAAVPTETLR